MSEATGNTPSQPILLAWMEIETALGEALPVC